MGIEIPIEEEIIIKKPDDPKLVGRMLTIEEFGLLSPKQQKMVLGWVGVFVDDSKSLTLEQYQEACRNLLEWQKQSRANNKD